ncbi:hypothetical protein SKAU_G00188340 [Synaphobranchus kaupii]|uniref:Uncharacterized protein n=1 Tax=Synaphobranchus kaupii TaxID=118154 RepID=A0A9Q1FCY9_SYNKA|nr:hypothetical protein SKAU_G00188340 [Synaphobranchus kaupii]
MNRPVNGPGEASALICALDAISSRMINAAVAGEQNARDTTVSRCRYMSCARARSGPAGAVSCQDEKGRDPGEYRCIATRTGVAVNQSEPCSAATLALTIAIAPARRSRRRAR